MGWRCVVVDTPCKLSVGNNYLIVRNDEVRKIHLSEIYCLMLACPAVNITGIALCELTRNKIKVIFCDEKRDPYGEITGYYGSHNCAKQLRKQIGWSAAVTAFVGTEIIAQKIRNQAAMLRKYSFDERAAMLDGYASEVVYGDTANREGHAAKVYFNTLFGMGFSLASRTVLTKLYKHLDDALRQDPLVRMNIDNLIAALKSGTEEALRDYCIDFSMNETIEFKDVFVMLGLVPDCSADSIGEKLEQFISICAELHLFKVIVLVQPKAYMSDDEMLAVYSRALGSRIGVVVLDNFVREGSLCHEKKVCICRDYSDIII